MVQLTSGTADSITSKLLWFFTAKNIPTKTLFYMESDKTSVMLGKLNGVATQLKALYPFLTEHHSNYVSLFDIKLQLDATIKAITTKFIDDFEILLFVQNFAKAVIESLKERFPDYSLVDAFRIFYPKELPIDKTILGYYGQKSIQKLINFYDTSKFIKDNI
ncbi:14636_t:CDS:2 [Cetraspora pellucida]|uniref:14636_t:CDS:1 n=1 Tax=Cetraspora pellucida TaxID=1433469 RepID=A0A9N9JZI7_9GLOM|nr:14636_t:CDS:2 [Cetraspora pellucida]